MGDRDSKIPSDLFSLAGISSSCDIPTPEFTKMVNLIAPQTSIDLLQPSPLTPAVLKVVLDLQEERKKLEEIKKVKEHNQNVSFNSDDSIGKNDNAVEPSDKIISSLSSPEETECWDLSDIDLSKYDCPNRKDKVQQRNRISALNYRKRKWEEIETLDEKVKRLEDEKCSLLTQVRVLNEEVKRKNQVLEDHLLAHDCSASSIEEANISSGSSEPKNSIHIVVKNASDDVMFLLPVNKPDQK